MPIEYVILAISGDHINAKPILMLIARIIGLEKLQDKLEAHNNVELTSGVDFYGVNRKILKIIF
jgi:hypothetical protein